MAHTATRVYIGLGSNLQNPEQQINRAFIELGQIPDTQLLTYSPLYRSAAIGPAGQPDYINACAALETQLDAHTLLDALQAIEIDHQRIRKQHWGPRTLDLDILLFGDQVIHTERLQVPHPYLCRRNFVLYPLADIAAETQLPHKSIITVDSGKKFGEHAGEMGKTIAECLQALQQSGDDSDLNRL